MSAKGSGPHNRKGSRHIEFPFTCFLLRNGEENILVDTGMKQSYLEQMAIGECCPTGSTRMLLDELAEEGLTPADITSVIYTHLHYDHCANGELFLDVPNYVQRDEYRNLKTRMIFRPPGKIISPIPWYGWKNWKS